MLSQKAHFGVTATVPSAAIHTFALCAKVISSGSGVTNPPVLR